MRKHGQEVPAKVSAASVTARIKSLHTFATKITGVIAPGFGDAPNDLAALKADLLAKLAAVEAVERMLQLR